jgi:hypothetical protein
MGKPIPEPRRMAAFEACIQYGLDKKTAGDIITKMVMLLERNEPHQALLSVRRAGTGFTIARIYHLIYVLMTGEK